MKSKFKLPLLILITIIATVIVVKLTEKALLIHLPIVSPKLMTLDSLVADTSAMDSDFISTSVTIVISDITQNTQSPIANARVEVWCKNGTEIDPLEYNSLLNSRTSGSNGIVNLDIALNSKISTLQFWVVSPDNYYQQLECSVDPKKPFCLVDTLNFHLIP